MKTRHRKKTNKKIKLNRRSRRGGAPVDIDAEIARLSDSVKATVKSKVEKLNITNEIDANIVEKALLICKIKSLNIKECESKILNKENLKKLKQLGEKIKKTYKKEDIPNGFKIFEKFISDLSPSQWISDVTTPSTESITDSITEFIDTTEVGKARELREDDTQHANNWCLFVRTAIIILLEKIKFKLKPQLEHTTIEPVVKKSMRRRFGESIGSVASAISSAGTSAKRFVRLGEDNKNEAVYFYNIFSLRLGFEDIKPSIVYIDTLVYLRDFSKYQLEFIKAKTKITELTVDDTDIVTELQNIREGSTFDMKRLYELFVKFKDSITKNKNYKSIPEKLLRGAKSIDVLVQNTFGHMYRTNDNIKDIKKRIDNSYKNILPNVPEDTKHLKQEKKLYISWSRLFIYLIRSFVDIFNMLNEKNPDTIKATIRKDESSTIEYARKSTEKAKAALENSSKSVKEIGRIRDAMQRSMALSEINIKEVIKYENLAVVINELVKIYAEFIKTKLTTSQEEIKDSIRVANKCLAKINTIEKIIDMDSRETLLYYKGEAETVIKNMQSDIIGERNQSELNETSALNESRANNSNVRTAKKRSLVNQTARNNANNLQSAQNAIDAANAEETQYQRQLNKLVNSNKTTSEYKLLFAKKEYATSKKDSESTRLKIEEKKIELRKKKNEQDAAENKTTFQPNIDTLEGELATLTTTYEINSENESRKKATVEVLEKKQRTVNTIHEKEIEALQAESTITKDVIRKALAILNAKKATLAAAEKRSDTLKSPSIITKLKGELDTLQIEYNKLLEEAPIELRAQFAASNIANSIGFSAAGRVASNAAAGVAAGATGLVEAGYKGFSSLNPFTASTPATSPGP